MKELLEKQRMVIDKINAVKKRFMTHGYCIDLNCLEDIGLYKHGEKINAPELLDILFDRGMLISRGSAAITKIDNLAQFQLNSLYNELQELCEEISKEYLKQHTL